MHSETSMTNRDLDAVLSLYVRSLTEECEESSTGASRLSFSLLRLFMEMTEAKR